jgi:asparagine synthase (glutamine-hydrolysing)
VSLSGDGGDELFAGYNRYTVAAQAWHRIARAPSWLRKAAAAFINSLSTDAWNRGYRSAEWALPERWRTANAGEKARKLADVLSTSTPKDMYLTLLSHWKHPASLVVGGHEPPTLQQRGASGLNDRELVEQMMYVDLLSYLPDDILCKVDRAAMAVSLETRVPFLDHRIVEFAWTLPMQYRLDGTGGKRILRELLKRHLPPEVHARPKMGFGVPIQAWLRGPLRDWCESLIEETRLKNEGYLNPGPIRQAWDEHQSGRRDRGYELWDILMFQSWLDHQKAHA